MGIPSYTDAFGLVVRMEFEVPINEYAMSSGRWIPRSDCRLGGEDLFEWQFLKHAIDVKGEGPFRMVEVGCGYGRWMATAWKELRVNRKFIGNIELLGIEPSKARREFCQTFMRDNAVLYDPLTKVMMAPYGVAKYEAIGGMDAEQPFDYGQTVMSGFEDVQCFPLARIAFKDDKEPISYLSMDVQGMEVDVLNSEGIEELMARIGHVHISTHGHDLAEQCRERMKALGFELVTSIPQGHRIGSYVFIDGIEQFAKSFLIL